jgi:hypothetical protein
MTFPSPAHNNESPDPAARAKQATILVDKKGNELSCRALDLDPHRVGKYLYISLDAQSSPVLLWHLQGFLIRDHELRPNLIQSTVW